EFGGCRSLVRFGFGVVQFLQRIGDLFGAIVGIIVCSRFVIGSRVDVIGGLGKLVRGVVAIERGRRDLLCLDCADPHDGDGVVVLGGGGIRTSNVVLGSHPVGSGRILVRSTAIILVGRTDVFGRNANHGGRVILYRTVVRGGSGLIGGGILGSGGCLVLRDAGGRGIVLVGSTGGSVLFRGRSGLRVRGVVFGSCFVVGSTGGGVVFVSSTGCPSHVVVGSTRERLVVGSTGSGVVIGGPLGIV